MGQGTGGGGGGYVGGKVWLHGVWRSVTAAMSRACRKAVPSIRVDNCVCVISECLSVPCVCCVCVGGGGGGGGPGGCIYVHVI